MDEVVRRLHIRECNRSSLALAIFEGQLETADIEFTFGQARSVNCEVDLTSVELVVSDDLVLTELVGLEDLISEQLVLYLLRIYVTRSTSYRELRDRSSVVTIECSQSLDVQTWSVPSTDHAVDGVVNSHVSDDLLDSLVDTILHLIHLLLKVVNTLGQLLELFLYNRYAAVESVNLSVDLNELSLDVGDLSLNLLHLRLEVGDVSCVLVNLSLQSSEFALQFTQTSLQVVLYLCKVLVNENEFIVHVVLTRNK